MTKPFRNQKDSAWVLPVRNPHTFQRTTRTVDTDYETAEEIIRQSKSAYYRSRVGTTPEALAISCERYVEHVKERNREKPLRTGYKSRRVWKDLAEQIELHIKPFFKLMPTRDVSVADLHEFEDHLLDPSGGDLSRVSVKGLRAALKAIMVLAKGNGVINVDPYTMFRRFETLAFLRATRPARPQALSLDQVRKILDRTKGKERVLAWIMLLCGLRSGEAIALRWRCVDFRQVGIWVFEAGVEFSFEKEQRIMRSPTKTHAGARFVPMTPLLAKLLKDELAKSGAGPNDLVITNRKGEPYFYTGLLQRLRSLQNAIEGLPRTTKRERGPTNARNHIFRHTCVAIWITTGISFERIAKWIGHENHVFTITVYGHMLKDPEVPDF